MSASNRASWLTWLFGIILALAAFTGFGNMPLYRRYYIADLPGFAWTGDFFSNLYVHYSIGAVLVALSTYVGIQYMTVMRRDQRLTLSGFARAITLAMVLVSGFIMVLKNLPDTMIPFPWVAVLTLGHMAFAVLTLVLFFFSILMRWRWAVSRRRL
jgi:hypothetical protein